MKFGVRKPSFKKSLKARTTGKLKRKVKKQAIPFYGKKGTGIIKDPKKAIYNKVYNKTTVDALKPIKKGLSKSNKSKKNNPTSYSYVEPTTKAYQEDIAYKDTKQRRSIGKIIVGITGVYFLLAGLVSITKFSGFIIAIIGGAMTYWAFKKQPEVITMEEAEAIIESYKQEGVIDEEELDNNDEFPEVYSIEEYDEMEAKAEDESYIDELKQTYEQKHNMIYRKDGTEITSDDYKDMSILSMYESEKQRTIVNDTIESYYPPDRGKYVLNDLEKEFISELVKQLNLNNIPKNIFTRRMSNGTIDFQIQGKQFGRVRLQGRKHTMQILKEFNLYGDDNDDTVELIEGSIEDFIPKIPEWIKYIIFLKVS